MQERAPGAGVRKAAAPGQKQGEGKENPMNLYLFPRYNSGIQLEKSNAASGRCLLPPEFTPVPGLSTQHGNSCRTAPPIRGRGAGVMCGPAQGELRQRPGAAGETIRASLPGSA